MRKRNRQVQQLVFRCFDVGVDPFERLLAVQELQYRLTTEEARLLMDLRNAGVSWPSSSGIDDGDRPEAHRPRRVHNRYERKYRKQRADPRDRD